MRHQLHLILLTACYAIFLAGGAAAKPAPPDGLTELFENFREIEERYESQDWLKTQEELNEFVERFKISLPSLKQDTSIVTIKEFKAAYSNLKYSINAKDFETTEENFILFQKLFFRILNNYKFITPPALTVIQTDLGEVATAIDQNDFDDIVSEMKETIKYFEALEEELVAVGGDIKLIEKFKKNIYLVLDAGESKDRDRASGGLEQLQDILTYFINLYN